MLYMLLLKYVTFEILNNKEIKIIYRSRSLSLKKSEETKKLFQLDDCNQYNIINV